MKTNKIKNQGKREIEIVMLNGKKIWEIKVYFIWILKEWIKSKTKRRDRHIRREKNKQ